MSVKLSLKNRLHKSFLGLVFVAFISLFINLVPAFIPSVSTPVYAAPESIEAYDPTDPAPGAGETDTNTCFDQVGAIGWLVCPSTGVLGKAIDAIYSQIEKLLVIDPVATDGSSPIYQVWEIMRDITNVVFVVVLLIIVYSQITGLGISNYGIKKALPKLVVAAVLVNLSYILCALAVDVSNIIGASLKGVFTSIEQSAVAAGGLGDAAKITWTQLTGALIGGGTIAGVAIGVAGGLGAFLWPLVTALIGGILSVLVGLITIGLRQALVSMLIMIAPLAFVAYMLPNTESWFKKWKDIFVSMLIFYPMFSLLFGAAQLAGWAIVANSLSGNNTFGIVLGMAVQVFPLFLSISLLKMSGTVLGAVSNKLNGFADKPRAGARAFGDLQKEIARQRYISESHRPSAALRRYLDGQQRRRELDLENATKTRKALAEVKAQRAIAGGIYEPAAGLGQSNLRANRSTRTAKSAMNASLAAQYVTKDSAHLLDQYGDYYTTARDQRLAHQAGQNYLEFYRTMLAEENDAFADQDWVMDQFNQYRKAYNPSSSSTSAGAQRAAHNYNHYIVGAAGALGKGGEVTVLGEVISKSAANEAKRKSYTNYAFAKYGYNKRDARNMMVGYYNNDDGFAANPDGSDYYYEWDDANGEHHRVKEESPGEFLKYHPEWLQPVAYDKYEIDKNGKKQYYYDAKDQDGKFIGRVYKSDGPAMKEIISNWDMPIADPINGLYGILSGVKEGQYSDYGLDSVGLAQLSTTLGRATMSSGFKEKATFAGPMYATSVGQRYIQDYIHLNLARLDNLIKTAKPSGFNTQDAMELQQLQMLMNPENWEKMLFDYDSLMSFRNVNGSPMKGTRYVRNPETGELETISIPHDQATLDDLKNTVIKKYLLPAAPKFANMMSRITNGIIDNQKPGAADNWNKLLDSMELWNDEKWKKKYPQLINPFAKQTTDTIYRARQISRRIRPSDANKPSPELRERMYNSQQRANSGMDDPNNPFDTPYQLSEEDKRVDREYEKEEKQAPWSIYNRNDNDEDYFEDTITKDVEDSADHFVRIDLMAAENSASPDFFFDAVRTYLDDAILNDPRFSEVIDSYEEYITFHGQDASLTVEDHAQALKDLIVSYIHD